MKPLKTLLVCEFITGGGLVGEDLPEGLTREGTLMRDALLRDLIEIENWRVITTLDARLDAGVEGVAYVNIYQTQDPWAVWQQYMATADAIWVIAPESNHILQRFAAMAEASQTMWLGAGLNAIAVTTNKHSMAQILAKEQLPTIPTYFYDEWIPMDVGTWVVKPNDGAGCEATFLLDKPQAVIDWFAADTTRMTTHIIQPFIDGIAASVSALGVTGQAVLLSCNLQKIELKDGRLHYCGGVIHGADEYWPYLAKLTQKILSVIPDLTGYFGVDVLLDARRPEAMTLVEINPRLTTSYVYLRDAIGINVARIVLDAKFGNVTDGYAFIHKNRIEFSLEHAI